MTVIQVAYTPGWPSVPAEVVSYAGKLAADIFRADQLPHGLVETGEGSAYGKKPGGDLKYRLSRYLVARVI